MEHVTIDLESFFFKVLNLFFVHQSHYIEVAQGGIFMEQKMLFVLVFGLLAILKKKIWVEYELITIVALYYDEI
jgi:hypothetical protein